MGSQLASRFGTFQAANQRWRYHHGSKNLSSRPTGVKGVLTAVNLSSALALSRYPTFIIGGAQVYGDALGVPEIDTIYATEVDATFSGTDTFFPELDMTIWQEMSRTHHPADDDNAYAFDFVTYRRKTVK